MSNSTQSRHRISGTVDWKRNGYVDIYYPEPSSDAKYTANGTCIRNPSYSSKCPRIFYMSNSTTQFTEKLYLLAYMCPLRKTYLYTGCFTTLGHRRWFPRSLWSKKLHINICPFWTVTDLWPLFHSRPRPRVNRVCHQSVLVISTLERYL
jgi:hypothetical protein